MNTFRHIGIVVKNLERSQKFYKKYFNFKVKRKMKEGGKFLETLLGAKKIKAKTTKMSDSTKEVCLELLYFYKNKNFKQNKRIPSVWDFGPTHFAITVKNLDKKYTLMRKNKIKFINKPIISVDGKAKVAFCKDPDGVLLELVELL